jgi:TPR repeat protein
MLGIMYDSGQGVPQDYTQAAKWYRLAADQGNAIAESKLGVMYYFGQGVPQDYTQAHKWLNLAASQGNTEAGKNRDLLAALMTPAQIADAQKLASEWRPVPTPQ